MANRSMQSSMPSTSNFSIIATVPPTACTVAQNRSGAA